MYLKKLELVGFKSFADKTEFTFPRSVTAIVGPNGCGKSNLVDAFKWVFGEQSARGLRGEEMKDVIFNGAQTRPPTGLAEVTVVFENSDRALDIDYAEVAITRRLYRSGESEYLINKHKCRLRDIKELFLDTGLGTSSYSMLEQGKIDVLLQSNTLDRRIIFEEAAGISRYRVKKAESLRALERTEENLARLGDIIDEVEKRMHRVKVQAGKARKYRECFERLRSLRVRSALEDYGGSVLERVELSSRRVLLDHQVAHQEETAARLREGLERHRSARGERQASLAEARERLAEARTGRERTEERIRLEVRRLEELGTERQRKIEERGAEEEARKKLVRELERLRGGRDEAAAEIVERRLLLEERLSQLVVLEEERKAISRELERMREVIVASLQDRSRVGNRLVQLDSELGSLGGRRERTAQALKAARAEEEAQAARARNIEEELHSVREQLLALDRSLEELDRAAGELEEEAVQAEGKHAQLLRAFQERRSRLDVLSSFHGREGPGEGGQALLERARSAAPAEVLGPLADSLRVARSYAPAVEAALGEHAQALVVRTQEGGLEILALGREGASGGLEVIALDRVQPPTGSEWGGMRVIAEAGVLGRLVDRVEAPPEFRELLDRLLEGVILVEDLPTAVGLSRNGLRPYRLVTLDGTRVEPWGAMANLGPAAAGGIISRRSEMAELEAELSVLSGELEAAGALRDEIAASQVHRERKRRETAQEREATRLRAGVAESTLAQTVREGDHALREARVLESELREIAAQEESLALERTKAAGQLEALDRRREEENRSLLLGEEEAARAGEAHRVLGEAVTELKVRLAEAEERDEGLRRSLDQLSQAIAEEEKRQAGLEARIEELLSRHAQTVDELKRSRAALDESVSRESLLSRQGEAMEVEDLEAAEIEGAFGSELERLRSRADQARREREEVNLREQEGKLKRNALVEKIADEYGIDLTALWEGRAAPPADLFETVAPDLAVDSVVAGAGFAGKPARDRQADEEECLALREKLRHLGNVNLEALDELAELEERHRFMVGQREDLRKGQRDLREIIAEINRTSRELFLKTFESVQRYFGEIFRKCFGGGMAELVLEDGADLLEAGIEIIARPPGKKLTSLSLMSGGEKTMTTIALLFAIFKSRPSPICILDEVDAALDENNIRRFVVLLGDFVKESQFIIVTHNKITMAEADSLVGITMEQRGISKLVAVELESYVPEKMSPTYFSPGLTP